MEQSKFQAKSDLAKFRDTLLSSHNIRGSCLQRWVQISCGVLMLSIVIICLFTLVKLPNDDNSADLRTRNTEFSDSLLVKRIQSTLPNPVSSSDLSQDDIFISVKTSGQFHQSRLNVILQTWFQLARRNTFFFTDEEDEVTSVATGGHLLVTNCPPDHSRQALSCKMQAEFDMFLRSNKR